MLPKLPIILKKASNRSRSALNLEQKKRNLWTHRSTSSRSEARGLQRWPYFKYYNVLKQENRFTLGLDVA